MEDYSLDLETNEKIIKNGSVRDSQRDRDAALLVELMRGHPHLYDKDSKGYKDPQIRENSWSYIASKLNLPVSECQTRWVRLRERFCREKRMRDIESKKGVETNKIRFVLFEKMTFLDPFVKRRRGRTYRTNVVANNFHKKNDCGKDFIQSNPDYSINNLTTNYQSMPVKVLNSDASNIAVMTPLKIVCTPQVLPEYADKRETLNSGYSADSQYLANEESDRSLSSYDESNLLDLEASSMKQNKCKRKRLLDNSLQKSVMQLTSAVYNYMASKKNIDADVAFGDLIAAELKRISEPKKSAIKRTILNVLFDP